MCHQVEGERGLPWVLPCRSAVWLLLGLAGVWGEAGACSRRHPRDAVWDPRHGTGVGMRGLEGTRWSMAARGIPSWCSGTTVSFAPWTSM